MLSVTLRRTALLSAVPIAAGMACAAPALAATPKVSFRVEGAKRTLLTPRTVSVPSSGSITKGATPAGACPADSAAGALDVATHGRWDGTYSSGLGIDVTDILGTSALYSKGSYWEFFVNDRVASEGVCDTKVRAGEQFLFAQVPAKGTEYPLIVSAPKRVAVGEPFDVRTFYDPGKGAAHGVSGARYATTGGGRVRFAAPMTSESGTRRVSVTRPGTLTLTASATGEIRSAPVTITVTR